MKFIQFASPELGEEEIAEVVDTLRSGWLTTGPKVKRFETDFAEFLGASDVEAVAVNSATAGLHLALEAIGVREGDEVITTTYTFTATAEVIRYLGAHPVFVDVSPETLCIDPDRIEAAITPRTKAIVPVHLGGMAADMSAILDIARKHGLHVVEDAAHALPTTSDGKLVGALGSDAAVFSFYANKTITTGEGGMLVTPNKEIAARARVMRLHGISHDAFDRYSARAPSWYYEVIAPGFKYNMSDIAAAIGIHQLKKAHLFRKRRAEIAALYDELLADLPLALPPRPGNDDLHSWHLYLIRLRPEAAVGRDAFIERMYSAGVGLSVHYIPLHLQPYWRDTYKLDAAMFPASQSAFEGAVSLPIYPRLSDAEVVSICTAARNILENGA